MVRIVEALGQSFIDRFRTFYNISDLGYDILAELLSRHGRKHLSIYQLINQILFTGVDAFLIITAVALSTGIIISVQAMNNMPEIGAGEYFGEIMIISIIRELGPFFTSLIVVGRSGSALAAYIGNMKVSKEIAALNVMGVNLIHFVALPTFLGMLISVVALNVFYDIIAIVGGLFLANYLIDINLVTLLNEVFKALKFGDIILFLGKDIVFGTTISVISTYYGLGVKNIRMVPRAVLNTVVMSLAVTIIANLVFTVVYYAL